MDFRLIPCVIEIEIPWPGREDYRVNWKDDFPKSPWDTYPMVNEWWKRRFQKLMLAP